MKKRDKIIYWIATAWLAIAMLASGIQQLFNIGGFVAIMESLHYPSYFSTVLGFWKVLGAIVILMPKSPLLKEWAYAGFFFTMSGAIFSHLAIGDETVELFGPLFLLILTVVSWYFRPLQRKLHSVSNFGGSKVSGT